MFFKLLQLPVGSMKANCYLLIDIKSHECIIVDPGDDSDYIVRILQDESCLPKAILATHGHFDHIMGGLEIQLALNIPFLINKKDKFLVSKMKSSVEYYLNIKSDPEPHIDGFFKDADILDFGVSQIKVIETPGHTPGSVCFYSLENNILLSGDLLFAQGIGRTDFSYSSIEDLKKSLKKIFSLPSQTNVWPGHGQKTTLAIESKYLNY